MKKILTIVIAMLAATAVAHAQGPRPKGPNPPAAGKHQPAKPGKPAKSEASAKPAKPGKPAQQGAHDKHEKPAPHHGAHGPHGKPAPHHGKPHKAHKPKPRNLIEALLWAKRKRDGATNIHIHL